MFFFSFFPPRGFFVRFAPAGFSGVADTDSAFGSAMFPF
jgi:hypothetical protein